MICHFVPCDLTAHFAVTVEGETPVPLCDRHCAEYQEWLEKNAIDAAWNVEELGPDL